MVSQKYSTISFIILFLAVQEYTLPASEASNNDPLTVNRANEYIAKNKDSINQTYRLQYHLMAPIGWINDPNGFIYFRGEYHVFYQYNPYGSKWDTMHWGHAKSKDLIHWEHLPVALAPDQEYDKGGVFSGCSIEKDGKLYVMYTGHLETHQVQNIAVSEDGLHFEKIPQNPVLDENDLPSNAQIQDFRDPKVFQRGDDYYVILVSRTKANTGQALLYESKDLINWSFKSILLEGTKEQGEMWECPDLFQLDGKDVLLMSLVRTPRSGNDYHNVESVVEFIGQVDWHQGKMNVESVKELDHSMDFYATQTLLDDKNRRVAVSWMNMWYRNYPTDDLKHGWTAGMALPRELHLKNGYLTQAPIDEVRNTYQNTINLQDITLNNEFTQFDNVQGNVAMLKLVANLAQSKYFNVELRVGKDEKTLLSYDISAGEITLDRKESGVTILGEEKPPVFARKVAVPLEQSRLKLQVFLDKSSIEVFVNDGVETLTTTVYPTEANANGIRFGAAGTAVIERLSFSLIKP